MSSSGTGLRRVAWGLSELEEADRAWIIAQLTDDERGRISAVVNEVKATAKENHDDALATVQTSGLPRWLAARVLLALPDDRRREQLKLMTVLERLMMIRATREAAKMRPMTPLAARTLLASLEAPSVR